MNFREWFLEAHTMEPPKVFKQGGHLHRNNVFYLDNKGQIQSGYPGDHVPYVERVYGELRLHYLSPQSKLFRDLAQALVKMYGKIILDAEVSMFNFSHPETGRKTYSRTVRYWLSQSKGGYSLKNIPQYLYHGTCTNLWHDNIRNEGLLPRMLNKNGAAGSYGAANMDSLSHKDKIYLSTHPDIAARAASRQAASRHGGNPLILKIDARELDRNKFGNDEDAEKYTKDSIQFMGAVAYAGRIPARLITPFVMGVKTDETSHRADKWVPFKDVGMAEHPLTTKLKGQPQWFSSHDSPYYWALVDAGIVKNVEYTTPSGHRETKIEIRPGITDEEIRAIIKNSPWVQDAEATVKDVNNWGMSGLKSLDRTKRPENLTSEQEKVLDLLLKSGLYREPDGYFELTYFKTEPAIKLARMAYAEKIDYRKLTAIIKSIVEKQ